MSDQRSKISISIAIIVEFFLLLVILLLFVFGVIGVLMPIIPGLVFFTFGVAVYFFLLKNKDNKITIFFHRYLVKLKGPSIKILDRLKNNENIMGLINFFNKKIQQRREQKILKFGLILLGFNFILTLGLFFSLVVVSVTIYLFKLPELTVAFAYLMMIFISAAICAVIWYRFGQVLAKELKGNKILSTGLVVLISIAPLLFLLMFLAALSGGFYQISETTQAIFNGAVFMAVLAGIFEAFIVNLGMITNR